MKGKLQGLWERIYWSADAKIPRSEMSAGLELSFHATRPNR
jgi:hypothetical protein